MALEIGNNQPRLGFGNGPPSTSTDAIVRDFAKISRKSRMTPQEVARDLFSEANRG